MIDEELETLTAEDVEKELDDENDEDEDIETPEPEPKSKKKGKGKVATATKTKPPAKKTTTNNSIPHDDEIRRVSTMISDAGDFTRLKVLLLLQEEQRNVGSLCKAMKSSQPAISHHLALMRRSNVVQAQRQGKESHYSLTPAGKALTRAALSLANKEE